MDAIIRSSSDSTSDGARPNDNTDFIAEHHVDPGHSLFPWRHSPAPLPRLVPDTPEYTSQGGFIGPGMPPLNKWIRGAMYCNAASMLNIPAYEILLFRRWDEELAEDFRWAFQMAVAGLISNTYRVPIDRIFGSTEAENTKDSANGEPFSVSFDQTVTKPEHSTQISEDRPNLEKYDDESCPDVDFMLQKQLRGLYQTARDHTRNKLQIKLRTEPLSAEIVSMFLVPFITRERVEKRPALRHAFRNVWVKLEEKEAELERRLGIGESTSKIAEELEKLAMKQADGQGMLESTIIAQVAIHCREAFSVIDTGLGEVVQGDPDGKPIDVTHLVRFEMVVQASVQGGPSTLGKWQITDWDDLLDGNVWYM